MSTHPTSQTSDELLLRELLDDARQMEKQLNLLQRRIIARLGPKPQAPKQIEFTSPTGKKRTIKFS